MFVPSKTREVSVSKTQHAIVSVQDQARRHVQFQQREKHPRSIQDSDLDVQLAPGDLSLSTGNEETDPVDRRHVSPLLGQHESEYAGQDSRHEVDGTGRVNAQGRNQRLESVGDVGIETPGAAIRKGSIEKEYVAQTSAQTAGDRIRRKGNPGRMKLHRGDSAGFFLPSAPVLGGRLDIVPFEE